MRSIFQVSWKWIDISDRTYGDTFDSLNEAEAYRDKLVEDQRKFSALGLKDGEGKLEITIERFNFDVECSKVTV